MSFPKAIITKPFLVSDQEYKDLGLGINLVGYDSFSLEAESKTPHASPRLLNCVEPFEVSGTAKTLFYTEVNSNFQVGDRVYILNGNYDSDDLIKKDKYKKGRDGYKVLKVDQCKVVLDIDYTGALPYNDDSFDDYIKVYYINSTEAFLSANRQVTTRGGNFDYKFNYYQNNIAFIERDLKGSEGWGLNAGVSGAPGFFVRDGRSGWTKISDELVYHGSFSVALSPTYLNNGRMAIMDASFYYDGIHFKEGSVYKWTTGQTSSRWEADATYSPSIITKSNFRNGSFAGKFNNGLYGTQKKRLEWNGKGTWNGGTMVNTRWKSGSIDSKLSFSNTYRAELDQNGAPFQKLHASNNGGFGYSYVFDSEIESSVVINGNFFNTSFEQATASSVVEGHILSTTQSFANRIAKAHFELCRFSNIQIDGGEIKNSRILNSRVANVKSINSYFEKSVLKDSTYVSDKIIKILGYDEWNMSEYLSSYSATFSTINDVNSKIYKFYISKENFRRMKSEDTFYIKGLKVKGNSEILGFFDGKFRLTSWTEFYDDYSTGPKSATGVDQYSFYKRGFDCSAFLSTPEENASIINSYEGLYSISGATVSKYTTSLLGKNPNAGYSIDIIVSRHDLVNKSQPMESTSEWYSSNPKDFNYSSDVVAGTAAMPAFLGSNIDISTAYILDSDFGSGIIETSDWNSGHHINYNNDVVITSVTSSGHYSLEIDSYSGYLKATTGLNNEYPEKIGEYLLSEGDIVFLNSIDYDTRGMVSKVTLVATGSGYSSTASAFLVNTKVSSLAISNPGTYYTSGTALSTRSSGSGTGLTLDISAREIGSVLSITYSAPMSGGGSYSMNLFSSVSTTTGPIDTASFVFQILTDDALGTVTGIPNATYSVFEPPMTAAPSGATGVGAIFVTGPIVTDANGATASPSNPGVGLTLNYKTSADGSITYLETNSTGSGYLAGQIFKIEGGNATFSITAVTSGEIESIIINNAGEDYLVGDVLEIVRPFDPNSSVTGITASFTVVSITASNTDTRGLLLELSTLAGNITGLTISNPGLYYTEGEIFTITGGNLDALVRIDSVEGSLTRLNDAYKLMENDRGVLSLKDLGTNDIIAGLLPHGIFYTADAMNRWGYISKTKIEKTKIKSGIFRRPYISNSLIRDIDYDSTDIDMANYDKTKNLLVADTLFSSNSNILSSATYLYSNFVGGSDIWNDGIINKSVINGLTFSKGTIRQSSWIDGNFTGGMFYNSKSFDAKPTEERPNFSSDRVRSYYMTGNVGPSMSNNRYSWRKGKLTGGQFYKSDWESGTMEGGTFVYSKFYGGTINGGTIGSKSVSSADTRIYDAQINYATVENASVYSEDTSYAGLSSSSINWMDGIFNGGIFGSNNDAILGMTESNSTYTSTVSSLPIADYRIAIATHNVVETAAISGDYQIDAKVSISHSYLGDLIINLMSPNGKIINLKKRYSCSANDSLISTSFTSDSTKPSIEIGSAPYTAQFKFEGILDQGAYYDLNNKILSGIEYQVGGNEIAPVIDYRSFPPTTSYEGDRYLVVATASDPNWTPSALPDWQNKVGLVLERNSSGAFIEDSRIEDGDIVFVKNKSEYLKLLSGTWAKSYHSNTASISDLLNTDKTVSGEWKLLVMDISSLDKGFVEQFELSLSYKSSYVIRTLKNSAVWNDGIFNGGQFIDLGVWKNGKFNGGKFISTFGYDKSGSYLMPSESKKEYSWQGGQFNGGEFGNESLLSNSTWFDGEFNGGVFKGKLWNNGVFTYGEFKGGSSLPAIGGGIKSENAQTFIDSFKGDYYGVWRNGVVSDKKDDFITDRKIFTEQTRAMAPTNQVKSAKFENMLWVAGTFEHPGAEMTNSVWLDGNFKMGVFRSSAFNPYVKRKSDALEFVKDDSCIWENGKLIDSEFHISKWKYGQFISGTAVGMIWQDGIASYMNAYNIFWEKGVWRNGNWHGSAFDYKGKLEDAFAKEILNRGIQWSGAPYCHIWNIFENVADKTSSVIASTLNTPGGDSFSTTNREDSGFGRPLLGTLFVDPIENPSESVLRFSIGDNGNSPIKEYGFIYTENDSQALAESNPPEMTSPAQSGVAASGTTIFNYIATSFVEGDSTTGWPPAEYSKEIPLNPGKFYSVKGYAINSQSEATGPSLTNTLVFQTPSPNTITTTDMTLQNAPNAPGGLLYTSTGTNTYTQEIKGTIKIESTYVVSAAMPEPGERGICVIIGDIGGIVPTTPPNTSDLKIYSNPYISSNNPFTSTISSVLANKVYYIRSFTRNYGGVGYGPLITITSGVNNPVVSQSDPTTSLNGSVTSTGGSSILERGFIIMKSTATFQPDARPSLYPENVALNTPNTNTKSRIPCTSGAVGAFSIAIAGIGLTPGQYKAYAYSYRQIAGAPNDDYDYCNAFAYSTVKNFTVV